MSLVTEIRPTQVPSANGSTRPDPVSTPWKDDRESSWKETVLAQRIDSHRARKAQGPRRRGSFASCGLGEMKALSPESSSLLGVHQSNACAIGSRSPRWLSQVAPVTVTDSPRFVW